MLASLKRKLGVATPVGHPGMPGQPDMMAPAFIDPAIMPQLQFTVEELGMLPGSLPNDRAMFSPSAIPVWLQEQVRLQMTCSFVVSGRDIYLQSLTDLGLPSNGSDGMFLQMGHNSNGWQGDFPPMPEAW